MVVEQWPFQRNCRVPGPSILKKINRQGFLTAHEPQTKTPINHTCVGVMFGVKRVLRERFGMPKERHEGAKSWSINVFLTIKYFVRTKVRQNVLAVKYGENVP